MPSAEFVTLTPGQKAAIKEQIDLHPTSYICDEFGPAVWLTSAFPNLDPKLVFAYALFLENSELDQWHQPEAAEQALGIWEVVERCLNNIESIMSIRNMSNIDQLALRKMILFELIQLLQTKATELEKKQQRLP